MRIPRTLIVCLAVTVCLIVQSVTMACPFCSAPSLTLTERLAQADAAVLVEWIDGQKPAKNKAGNTVYRIKQIARASGNELKVGGKITLPRYRTGKKGELFMLMGSKAVALEWGSPMEVSGFSFAYLTEAPSPDAPTAKRLAYFVKFLEAPDRIIANDAYAEFANAPYKDITAVAKLLPREKIRKWVASSETPVTRIGLYGLLIGLCGTKEDAKLIEAKISEKTDDFRLGMDGVMSGYLMLMGDKGLDVIDKLKLTDRKVAFSETYSAMQALRFMWTYGNDRIKKERLRQSMRLLLDRPELADLVIADLARWKDWSVQSQLMEIYGKGDFNVPSIKRAIIRYMIVSTRDTPSGDAVKKPPHVVDGEKHLKLLRQNDPKTVKQAERFFFLK